jgi:AcrR family transcriptional regulator
MSMNRWQKRQQRTRLDFLMATLQLVLEHGYDKMTVSDIAERADYGRSTFYNYFNSKQGVVWALFEHFMGMLDAQIIDSVKHLSSPEREYISWQIIFTSLEQQRPFFMQLIGQETLPLRQMMKEYLIKQFGDHLKAGRFSLLSDVPPELVARYYVVSIMEILEYWMLHPEIGTANDMATQLFLLMFRQTPPGK